MKRMTVSFLVAAGMAIGFMQCSKTELTSASTSSSVSSTVAQVAQTSAQLASGTSINLKVTSDTSQFTPSGHHQHNCFPIDGLNLLAPTDQLLAIIDAESAGDFRGLRISSKGGATITNYDASGAVITLTVPASNGPEGCSFSGGQFPQTDSTLAKIAKTVIDFGTGVTFKRDTISITRSGKIIITRTGDAAIRTEITTFDNYKVNGSLIEGTKTRITTFTKSTGSGSSTTHVTDGQITFSDGTVATWISDRSRKSTVTTDSLTHHIVSGTVATDGSTSVTSNGATLYSHVITKTITEDLSCKQHHGPVSGQLETIYNSNTILIDFGDGTCTGDTVTITVNGVTTTKTISD